MNVLELGTTVREIKGSTTVDLRLPADLIHNLNETPYPFPSDYFDLIIASHVIEHLNDTIDVMTELWRIAKPGAKVIIRVPHYSSSGAYEHPTHVRYFSFYTFSFFDGREEKYSDAVFKAKNIKFRLYKSHPIGKFFNWLANIKPGFFERHLAHFFGIAEVITELEVIKDDWHSPVRKDKGNL